ncbi:MAG: sporulation protein YhbH [Peptococcaceae bacterium]|nr:sporulation protein YhbH [Peptococcaceae bacterium]
MSDNIISKDDWSLHRKGYIDQERHKEKVKEAVKNNLGEIISEEGIILTDGRKTVKVPIKSLQEFHFRYDFNKQKHTGQGNGKSKVGDVLGREQTGGLGKGPGAGEEPGVDYYEAEVSLEELAEVLFADLELPNLDPKKTPLLTNEGIQFNDVRKQGITANIDKKRTLIEAIKRNSRDGREPLTQITPEDLRYKTWEIKQRYESNAVVIAMMDTSGSMGNFEKYIARTYFFWMVQFLRSKYQNVAIRFLAHHTEAKEVSEQEFFTRGESGGTRCSSVYRLALDIISKDYNPADYNIYPFHFTDGDNISSDNENCVKLVNQLLEHCNLFGYGEILRTHYTSTLMTAFKRIQNEKFRGVTIRDKNEVYKALKTFFAQGQAKAN